MARFVIAAVLVVIAVVVAVIVDRRKRNDAPTQPHWAVPQQLDRNDFAGPEVPWLIAVFTSATCDSCKDTMAKARVLASDDVVVDEAEVSARKDVHDRYGIDAVPLVVIADAEGVVRGHVLGPPTATDLWAAVADLRDRG